MGTRLLALAANDFRLQFRYGIYYAYGFVIAFYVTLLVWGGEHLPPWVSGLVIFTDPSVIGFFFIGALMMLEKSENTRSALAMTPISAANFFWAKCLTLTSVSLIAVTVLTPFLHQGIHWPMLAGAVVMSSVFFIGIAVPASLYFRSVTSFLIGAAGWLVPVVLPGFVALIEPMPHWAILIPTASQFKLILIATGTGSASGLEIAAMFAVCVLAMGGSAWLAISRLKKELGGK